MCVQRTFNSYNYLEPPVRDSFREIIFRHFNIDRGVSLASAFTVVVYFIFVRTRSSSDLITQTYADVDAGHRKEKIFRSTMSNVGSWIRLDTGVFRHFFFFFIFFFYTSDLIRIHIVIIVRPDEFKDLYTTTVACVYTYNIYNLWYRAYYIRGTSRLSIYYYYDRLVCIMHTQCADGSLKRTSTLYEQKIISSSH